MKKIFLTGLVIILLQTLSAQKIMYYDNKFSPIKIEKVFVIYTGDKEMDEAIKYGFEHYWKFSPFQFVTIEESKKLPKNAATFIINNYEIRDAGLFSYSEASLDGHCVITFDNFTVVKDNEINGIDKNTHIMATKIIQYIMVMNQQYASRLELGVKKYIRLNLKSKLEGMTLLIPKEYFDNGLSESVVAEHYKGKYIILSSDEILKRLKEKKDIENCAELILSEDANYFKAFILDLNTGDDISETEDGKFNMNRGQKINDSRFKTLLKHLQ